jgi:hypothetical protein
MFNSARRATSVAAFALSMVVTLGMLGAVQELAAQPGEAAMLAKQGQAHIAASTKLQPTKT